MPRITVCIPVYNLEQYIAEALDSLKAQTYQDYEAIIVNDGSTDKSEEIITPYLEDPRFRYIRQENGGVARARETATLAAKGEWFAHLDGDDLWLPDKLERQMALIDSEKRTNLVYGNVVMFFEDGRERIAYTKSMPKGDIIRELYRDNFLCTSSVMIKTADIKAVGGYPILPYGEDYMMWLRIARKGVWAARSMEVVARYRLRAHSQVSDTLLNNRKQIEIMTDALNAEDRPHLAAILLAGLKQVKRSIAYGEARQAATGGKGDIEKLLWQSWGFNRQGCKRLGLAVLYSLSKITKIKRFRDAVIRQLTKPTIREEIASDNQP